MGMFLQKKKFQAGFTLVELLVTITIFVILTGIVLFNQTKFNSTILLTNLAYDTALTIRQAQTYGINIKEFNGSGNFLPYGVHFETGANNKSFILFADTSYVQGTDLVHVFASPTQATCLTAYGCVSRYNITRGNYISKLCSTGPARSEDCTVTKLDILFQRPNPDAKIYANGDAGTENVQARIFLSSSDNSSTREIDVQANGLIQIVD